MSNIVIHFEFKGWNELEKKLKGSFWTALKMNWKVWTPFQFVNINFVPVQVCAGFHHNPVTDAHLFGLTHPFFFQFRVLFANMVALFWYAYLASVRK